MKRTSLLIIAWVTSTMVAVGIAAAAVGSVRGQVTEAPSVPLQATATSLAAGAELSATPVPSTSVTPTTTSASSGDAAPPGADPDDATVGDGTDGETTPTRVETGSADDDATTTTAGQDDGGDGATTTAPTTSTVPPSTSTSTTTTTVVPVGPERRAYDLVGGTVVVDVGNETVTLIGASPAGGFSVEVDDAGPERVVVKFESSDHESEFVGRFEDGSFDPRIEERDREDDGHDGS